MPKFVLPLCVLALSARAEGVAARIEGVVRNMDGNPVPRAELILESAGDDDGQPAVLAASGENGAFRFDGIPPGRGYMLTARRAGYAETRYPAPLTLDAGAVLNHLEIVMAPQGVITGRVTDWAGDPVASAPVLALRPAYETGRRRMAIAARALTNDQGDYRIAHLAAGIYSVAVVDRRILPAAAGGPGEGYAPAYSAPLRIAPGEEARNVDIRLGRERVYAIRGRVVAADGTPAAGAVVMAVHREDGMIAGDASRFLAAASQPEAAFELRGLRPGTYLLQTLPGVRLNSGLTPELIARGEVAVTDRDVNDVILVAGEGVSVTGSVRWEGTGEREPAFPVTVELEEVSPLARNYPAGAARAGAFRIEHAAAAAHYLNVYGLPPNVYVKQALFNGQDVTRAPLELEPGGGSLQILLSDRAAQITGIVRDSDGLARSGAAVTLWPAAPDAGKASRGVLAATSDQNGAFMFHSLAPGEYFLAAWEQVEPEWLQDYFFLTQFSAGAVRLVLGEDTHAALEAPLIPAAKIRAAGFRLP